MTETRADDVDDKLLDQNAITESDMSLDKSIHEIFKLLNAYEEQVLEIQSEARRCREDNERLKGQIRAIIEENEALRCHQEDDGQFSRFRQEYIDLADKIIFNLRNQIDLCNKEKEMYESLFKRTSTMFEQEIPRNSIAKLKAEHSLELKMLRKELSDAKASQSMEHQLNATLRKSIKEMMEKLKAIQDENKRLHNDNSELNDQIKMLHESKVETEKLLDASNELNKEQMNKSIEAFEKMQDAIRLTEHAMAEVEYLKGEKQRFQEEYEYFTGTISSVIEQASERTDKEMGEMQRRHEDEVRDLRCQVQKLTHAVELERERTTSAMHHANALEQKLQSTDKTNSFLGKDLEDFRERLERADKEIVRLKATIEAEREQRQQSQYEAEKLRSVIEHNRKLNLKWKDIMLDITRQVQEKIKNLTIENHELRSARRVH